MDKTITLTVSEKVYGELRTLIIIRGQMGNMYGIADAVLLKIIKAIEEGKPDVSIRYKDEVNGKSETEKQG